MHLKFLGTGTSQGVPYIGCTHPVCLSEDPHDKRLRTSALVTTDAGNKILIDCGPDFRQQMLANHESRVDAVLITHEHNDHIIGLDDLRPIIFHNKKNMPLYAKERTARNLKSRFSYAFAEDKYPGAPSFDLFVLENKPLQLLDALVTPINVNHDQIDIFGFKFKNLAYITDSVKISTEEKQKLKNLDFLIINCLRRERPHHSHFILPQIFTLVEELQPKQTYLVHMSQEIGFHRDLVRELPPHIQPAYDGLEIEF